MTTAKWILCIIAASATSSYVTFHLNQINQNELVAASNIENSSQQKAANINATEQHQELANTKTTAGNHEINVNQTASLLAETLTNNVNQVQPAKIEDLQFVYEKNQNEITSFREFTERTGNRVLSVISKNYDSEPIDPEWARSKEDELLALLDNSKTLQNSAPLELSCKSQNCRLILSSHDESQSQSLYNAFREEALQGSDENKKQVISYFNNPDRGEIQIYLSKNTVRALLDGKME